MESTLALRATAALVAAAAAACGGTPDDLQTRDETRALVQFSLDGHEIDFVANPDGTISIHETMTVGDESGLIVDPERSRSALDEFVRLAPPSLPVPRALLEAATSEPPEAATPGLLELAEQVAASRSAVVESLPEVVTLEAPARAAPEGYVATQQQALDVAAGGSCGSSGASFFRERYCTGFGAIEHCGASYNGGNSVWYHNTNSTGSNRYKNTHSVVANCSSGYVRLEYEYRFLTLFHGWKWDRAVLRNIPTQRVVSTTDYGAVKRRRRMDIRRLGSSGGFRYVARYGDNLVF